MQYLLFLALVATVLSTEVEPVEPVRIRIPITEALVNVSNWQNVQIVGGIPVNSANKYPFAAAYLSNYNQFCGASIIAPYYALTAAHCIASANPSNEQIAIGSLRYDGAGNPAATYHSVSRTYIHPQFNRANLDYDVAVLELATPISFDTPNKRPITLAKGTDQFADYDATVIGWGTTSSGGSASLVLREVDTPVITNAFCNTMYSGVTLRMMCAYLPGKDSCQGDSGGPFFVLNDQTNQFEQIGIVSWGIGCAGVGAPGVYTRVTAVVSWVCQISGVGC